MEYSLSAKGARRNRNWEQNVLLVVVRTVTRIHTLFHQKVNKWIYHLWKINIISWIITRMDVVPFHRSWIIKKYWAFHADSRKLGKPRKGRNLGKSKIKDGREGIESTNDQYFVLVVWCLIFLNHTIQLHTFILGRWKTQPVGSIHYQAAR